MDSLTQITLGAAIGETTLGRKVGRKAMLWGAVCGTLPDLDVFIPLGGAVADFTYHRSASHSLFVLAALTPLVVWLILKIHPETRRYRRKWWMLVYLAFATHVILDSLTVYGTQIFWPVDTTPVALSAVFIIDPLYTIPLLTGVVAALVLARKARIGHRLNTAGLAMSSLYLCWSIGAKLHVNDTAREALASQNIAYTGLITTPAPFNTLLWRILATDEDDYYEGFYSILDDSREVEFKRHNRNMGLVERLGSHWPVQRLAWFTKGFYAVSSDQRDIVITDLRMGLEPDYVFRFKVGEMSNPHAISSPDEQLPGIRNYERLQWVWQRIWRERPFESAP